MNELCMLPWAGRVRQFFMEMNEHKHKDQAEKKTVCYPTTLARYEAQYDELTKEGAAFLTLMRKKTLGYDDLRKMVNRLKTHKDAYMGFMRDYIAPFTNNQAERDLRHCKTKQKVSGCYRSWQGLSDYCKIRSLTDTTQYDTDGWYERIDSDPTQDSPITDAIMDRIVHNAYVIAVAGNVSMRERHGLAALENGGVVK